MGAQKATQASSVSSLNAFYFLLLCPKIQTHFPRLTSDVGGGPSQKLLQVPPSWAA